MSDILQSIVDTTENVSHKKKRVEKAKRDFGYFCKTYLSDYFFEDAAKYQKILYDVANTQSLTDTHVKNLQQFVSEKYKPLLRPTKKLNGAMFIEPREHGKTVRWSFAYVLWRILSGTCKYVLLISATASGAEENLDNIKNELQENELILSDFGELKGDIWKNTRLVLSNRSCIQCKGAGSSMRGTRFREHRPDLIILDDLLKDEAVNSYTLRDKIHRWLKRTVFNLGKNSFIVWVNTVMHNDDPISRLCRELENGDLVNWIAVRLSCLKEDGKPLWPEMWDIKTLQDKKSTIGVGAFSTEYMNEPLADEERIIHQEWIDEHRYSELPAHNKLRFFLGVDPATGKHDGTALVSICRDVETGIIYVLPSISEKCSEQRTAEQMILLHSMYKYGVIGWEEVAFSGIYGNYIQKLGIEKNVYLPIAKIGTGGASKEMRVRSFSMLIQNGFIRFPHSGCLNIETQLTEFPLGAFDDLCDGLWLAIKACEKSGTGITAVSSIAHKARTVATNIIGRARL